jgi:hypothetical protein
VVRGAGANFLLSAQEASKYRDNLPVFPNAKFYVKLIKSKNQLQLDGTTLMKIN